MKGLPEGTKGRNRERGEFKHVKNTEHKNFKSSCKCT